MKARWFRTCGVLLACATLSTLVACGDDSTSDAGTAGTGTSGTGASGTGGGGGGTGGSKAGSGGGGSMAVMCGGVACTVNGQLKMLDPTATACCTPTTNKCGQTNGSKKCLEKNAPGTADMSCPKITVNIPGLGMFDQAGCCTPAKKCGGNYTAVEHGCVAREDVDMGMGGPLMSMMCGAGDGGDAGL